MPGQSLTVLQEYSRANAKHTFEQRAKNHHITGDVHKRVTHQRKYAHQMAILAEVFGVISGACMIASGFAMPYNNQNPSEMFNSKIFDTASQVSSSTGQAMRTAMEGNHEQNKADTEEEKIVRSRMDQEIERCFQNDERTHQEAVQNLRGQIESCKLSQGG